MAIDTTGMPAIAVWGDVQTWWDIPANRHSQGCNFSFADGHAEAVKLESLWSLYWHRDWKTPTMRPP